MKDIAMHGDLFSGTTQNLTEYDGSVMKHSDLL